LRYKLHGHQTGSDPEGESYPNFLWPQLLTSRRHFSLFSKISQLSSFGLFRLSLHQDSRSVSLFSSLFPTFACLMSPKSRSPKFQHLLKALHQRLIDVPSFASIPFRNVCVPHHFPSDTCLSGIKFVSSLSLRLLVLFNEVILQVSLFSLPLINDAGVSI